MRRWAWNIFCLLCLAIFLLGIVVWVRSYRVPADVEWFSRYTDTTGARPRTRTACFGIGYGPGTLGIFHYHGASSVPAMRARTWLYREFPPTRTLIAARTPDDRVNVRAGQFQVLHRIETRPDGWLSLRIVVVPLWVLLAAGIPPIYWWRRRRIAKTAPSAITESAPGSGTR